LIGPEEKGPIFLQIKPLYVAFFSSLSIKAPDFRCLFLRADLKKNKEKNIIVTKPK